MKQPEQVLPDVDVVWYDDTVGEVHGFCGDGGGPQSNPVQQVLYVLELSANTVARELKVAVQNYDDQCSENQGSQLDGGGDGDGDGLEVEGDAVIFHQTAAPVNQAHYHHHYYPNQ